MTEQKSHIFDQYVKNNRGWLSEEEYTAYHIYNPLNKVAHWIESQERKLEAVKVIKAEGNGVRELLSALSDGEEYDFLTIEECWLLARAYLNKRLNSQSHP